MNLQPTDNPDRVDSSDGHKEGGELDFGLEARLVDYLKQNPDFLQRHPDVISSLDIPHDSGGAVSLVERQIRVLREQASTYRKQFENLLLAARENDSLSHRLHRLTLSLIEAGSFDEVLNTLQDTLRDQFMADAVELKLFSNADIDSHAGEIGPTLFKEFMSSGRPSCGMVSTDQLEYLFGEQAGDTNSVALIPIKSNNLSGILAIGSRDKSRFDSGQSVDYLIQLGELVSQILQSVSEPGV